MFLALFGCLFGEHCIQHNSHIFLFLFVAHTVRNDYYDYDVCYIKMLMKFLWLCVCPVHFGNKQTIVKMKVIIFSFFLLLLRLRSSFALRRFAGS